MKRKKLNKERKIQSENKKLNKEKYIQNENKRIIVEKRENDIIKEKHKKNNEENVKKHAHLPFLPTVILILGFILGAFLYTNKSDGATIIKKYYNLLNEKNYDQMYELVETNLSKEDFINRVKNIYEGIEFSDAKINIMGNTFVNSENQNKENLVKDNSNQSEIQQENLNDEIPNVTYTVNAKCISGEIKFTRTSKIIKKDGKVKIQWSSSDIYPDLNDEEKIRVRQIEAKRGSILDRNGYTLAKDSEAYLAQLVPEKVNENTDFIKLSELTGIDETTLKREVNNAKNNQKEVTSNYIKLKKFSKDNQELKNKLLNIKGVLITDVKTREYTKGEAFSVLLGYVQDGEGKDGIELQFNNKLKAQNGCEIYIEDKNGNIKKSISKINAIDGNDVKLTIDSKIQEKIYNEFKEDNSAIVNINYKTGEILALVSTPSYDNNIFSLGMTDEEWNKLKNDENTPLYARFLGTYVPGSSIKPLVGVIGIENGCFKPEEDFGKYGLKWQKDESWGDFYITTLREERGENIENNLKNSIVFSDNIYFAQASLKIGKETLCKEFDKFGFNENLNFINNMKISTYGEITTEKDLASTGFGQGNLLVNPIMMSSIYSCFANEGNMIKPYIEFEKDEKLKEKIYKQGVISKENANIIKEDLIQAVKIGTGKNANIDGKTIAGKTGTAEIKSSKKDKNGTEIGWFDVFDESGNLIISMVENVKEKGGSNYVVKKIANILNSY